MNSRKTDYIYEFQKLQFARDHAVQLAEDAFFEGAKMLYNQMIHEGILRPGEIPPWLENTMLSSSNPSSLDIPSVRKVYLESMKPQKYP